MADPKEALQCEDGGGLGTSRKGVCHALAMIRRRWDAQQAEIFIPPFRYWWQFTRPGMQIQ